MDSLETTLTPLDRDGVLIDYNELLVYAVMKLYNTMIKGN